MQKVLTGVTTPVLTIFFQALNAKPPKSRDEIYHSNEWIQAMDPYCKQRPGKDPNTIEYVLSTPEDAPVTIVVEGGSLDYLERCFKSAIDAGVYGFMASKHVLVAEGVLKKAEDKK